MQLIEKQTYSNDVLGFVIYVFTDNLGNLHFDAAEICKVLGYDRKAGNVLEKLDDDEKRLIDRSDFFEVTHKVTSKGGAQAKWFITESGLYHLIMLCELPKAKPFRKWVTNEVLPNIRKTGSYQLVKQDLTEQRLIEMMVAVMPIKWTRQFFAEFWTELARVCGKTRPKSATGFAGWMGIWLRKYLVPLFPQSVVDEIYRRNPRKQWRNSRCRAYKFHQMLTKEIGLPKYRELVYSLYDLLVISQSPQDFQQFYDRRYPKEKRNILPAIAQSSLGLQGQVLFEFMQNLCPIESRPAIHPENDVIWERPLVR